MTTACGSGVPVLRQRAANISCGSALPAAALLALCVAGCGQRPEMHPVTEDCPAHRYLEEFRDAPSSSITPVHPQGAAEAYLEEGGGPAFSSYWHTVWVKLSSGEEKRVLTFREGDPGSGPSVSLEWSRDGQALFVRGWHGGINGGSDGGDVRVIYTLVDGRAWEVAAE